MEVSELFWNATLEELKCGYMGKDNYYVCLLCGEKIEKGIIYPENGILYEAEKYMQIHINKSHQSVFEHLTGLDKRITGLSDHQNKLLKLFYQGKSDKEVQEELGIGSSSTIRNHRFALKEKERQSKVFLVMMELLKEKDKHAPAILNPSKTNRMVDDRYRITEEENDEILMKFFPEGVTGPLKTFSIKEKYKIVVLREIAKKFESKKIYTEKEVNKILKAIYDDFVTLRRYLIEYGFLDRKPDGSQYWLKNDSTKKEELSMDRKKELKQQYKEVKPEAGIYQIKNVINNRILVGNTPNLKSLNGKRTQLDSGSFPNNKLQKEYKEYGKDAFVIEVLEKLEKKEDEFFDIKDELKKLEKKWLDILQPFGDHGYN
ncbi:MAG: DUF2087 domain-containing protein [Clostridia bacterium]|nr:DUF2087 domain-containing protein [Clostridia bacterium]